LGEPYPIIVLQEIKFGFFETIIGYGSPNKSGKASSHGAALGEDEIKLVRKKLKWKYDPFYVPEKIVNEWRKIGKRRDHERE
jgi:transketolase